MLLKQVQSHFDEAKDELVMRITHKEQGFNEWDNLYRSYIPKGKWPFNSRIFIPMVFSSIFEKDTRLITGKIKGKLVAGRYGSELGARIGTELLSSQTDDHDFYNEEPLVSKWLRWSQNARKYGAGFALVPWRRETKDGEVAFDGPSFEPLDNRKVYLQPGVASISDADYVIVERETTLQKLKTVNDASIAKNGKEAYRNLDILEKASATATRSDTEMASTNTVIRGLTGKSEGKGQFKRFKILTEYRNDIWITWCPDVGASKSSLGTIIRVIKNPYKHGLKPVIRLVYIPIDDDAYGVSEIEPGRSQQKAINALTSGFIEAVSTELYPIIKGHPTNVDWKTIEFKPRAAWIMNNPATDVVRLEGAISFTQKFVEAFKLLETTFKEAMGDTAVSGSNVSAMAPDKTATEIRDLALQRGARDNLNKLFLASAIQKMYALWWSMDQQFLSDKKVIKVAGRDAIEYFVNEGLNGFTLSNEGYELIEQFMTEYPGVTFEQAYESLREDGALDNYAQPLFPVKMGDQSLPKLQLERDGKSGFLSVENKDLTGQYRFSVDLNTIGNQNEDQEAAAMREYMKMVSDNAQNLAAEGYKPKYKELLASVGEKMKIRGAEQFFEAAPAQQTPGMQGQQPNAGNPGMGQGQMGGMGMNQNQLPIMPGQLLAGGALNANTNQTSPTV